MSLEFIMLGLSIRKVVCWYLLHDNVQAHSSDFVSRVFGETRDPRCYPPYSPRLAPTDFFLLKNCGERDETGGCSIDPTDCDERTKGDTGRSVFSGIQFVV
jgi:hypothetical protein